MSAHSSAPGLGRAQVATPGFFTAQQGSSIRTGLRPSRLTKRATAVAAATLCAPAVAAVALAGVGAAGGGSHDEMGTLAGTQGLRGTTVAASSTAPPQVSGPTNVKTNDYGKQGASTAGKSHPSPAPTHHVQRDPSPNAGTRAPTHKPPVHTTPKPPPAPRVSPPPQAPAPTSDPSVPGAPTTSGGAGTTTTSPGSNSSPDPTGGQNGRSGGDGHSGGD